VTDDLNENWTMERLWDRRTHFSRRLTPISLRVCRGANSGSQIVTMMQTAKPRHRNNPAGCFGPIRCFTAGRRSFLQRKMSSVLVVITDILVHDPFQVAIIEHDHMVEQISATIPDPALCDTILPRTSEACSLRLNAEALHRVDDRAIELCAAIKNQVSRSRVVGERLAQLLNNPGAGRLACHIAMQDSPPVMRNDEEAVQHSESECRHGKEIHRGNGSTMVAQKCHPSLCRLRIPRRFSHPTAGGPVMKLPRTHSAPFIHSFIVDEWESGDLGNPSFSSAILDGAARRLRSNPAQGSCFPIQAANPPRRTAWMGH